MGRLPHFVVGGARLRASSRAGLVAVALSALVAGELSAQIRPDASKATQGSNATKKDAKPGRSSSFPGLNVGNKGSASKVGDSKDSKPTAKAQSLRLVRLKADIALREVPAADSPTVGEKAKAGQFFLRLGEAEFGHVPVGSLTGFAGYVYASYLRDLGDGWGETTGTNVSFRARPRSGEPPLWSMPKPRTKLAIRGRDGDWYKTLSAPSVRAWLPVASVEDAGELPAGAFDIDDGRTVRAGLASKPAVLAQVKAHFDALEAAMAASKKAAANAAARKAAAGKLASDLDSLTKDYRSVSAEAALSVAKLDALLARVGALRTTVSGSADPQVAAFKPALDALAANLDRTRILALAKRAIADSERVAKKKTEDAKARVAEAAARKAALAKIASRRDYKRVGWIEFRPGSTDYRPFRLMKGGRTIAYLECSSGRYDLSDFTGREVGLIGELARPESAELRVLDVERLVILSANKR